jgi:hypothetical protein
MDKAVPTYLRYGRCYSTVHSFTDNGDKIC